ncbi:peptidoglycan recognition protein 1-like isoform X2 [Uloborus diversus]|uniref:peptidoglycan recognition protein 1-like isoform X2 n=1 Tax=Uloborus diversus TaxID=327109 RepID=UPI00240A9A4D|nr:peptidoglycan recognition protein 1-like isoform X2 [Uloborus diversus]XP_054713388.1 peptidoglycan recognition protein 1-like isoform X2 [Uloborus diversus]
MFVLVLVAFLLHYSSARGWWDIGYNFLVGGDGRIYEGRGWNRTGAFSVNFNTNSIGLSFIGNFNNDVPTQSMVNAALNFIKCGVQKGTLTPTREIHGHKDVSCTESPGNKLYAVIRQWDNYKGGRMPLYNCKPLPKPETNTDILDVGSNEGSTDKPSERDK